MNNSLISTLVLANNSEAFLASALDSLLAQTYGNWEAIVLDDASIDSTWHIAREYAGRDHRIHLLERNWVREGMNGIGGLRNRCLRHSRGDLIAVLDADDLRYSDCFDSIIRLFSAYPDAAVVSTQYDEIDTFGRILLPSQCLHSRLSITEDTVSSVVDITDLISSRGGGAQCPIVPCATVVRSKAISEVGGYSIQWRYHVDSNLYRRIASKDENGFLLCDRVLSGYRIHPNQMSLAKRRLGWVEPENL